MLKRDLIDQLHARFPQHFKGDLEAVVDIVFEAMRNALVEQRHIEIRGLGSFTVKPQKGREFINPRTGEPTSCPPGYRILFKAGKDLRALPDPP